MTGTQKIIAGVLGAGALVVVVVKLSGNDPPKATALDAGPAEVVVNTPPSNLPPPPKPVVSAAPSVDPNEPGPTSVSLATLAYEAKMVTRAQAALDKKDYKLALREIEDYEKIPNRELLSAEATRIKVDALVHIPGRKTDGLALAQESRSDDKMSKEKHEAIEQILYDAGLATPTYASP